MDRFFNGHFVFHLQIIDLLTLLLSLQILNSPFSRVKSYFIFLSHSHSMMPRNGLDLTELDPS